MDELLVSWLGSDDVYENVLNLIEKYRVQRKQQQAQELMTPPESPKQQQSQQQQQENQNEAEMSSTSSPRAVIIPPFYPLKTATGTTIQRRRQLPRQSETWEPLPAGEQKTTTTTTNKTTTTTTSTTTAPQSSLSSSLSSPEEDEEEQAMLCVRDQVSNLLSEMGVVSSTHDSKYEFSLDAFLRITKEVCRFPSFFNGPLYERILDLWNTNTRTTTTSTATTTTTDDDDDEDGNSASVVTLAMLEWFWKLEMEPYDPPERFFRLIKQPDQDCILRDDFLPYIKALLNNHPVSTERIHVVSSCPLLLVLVCWLVWVVLLQFVTHRHTNDYSLLTNTLLLISFDFILNRAWNSCRIMPSFKKSMR